MKKLFCLLLGSALYCHNAFANLPPAAAIASAEPQATAAGFKILQEGGNAFDAAIAVSAALAVVEPYHSGIGGGGFWLLHQAKNGQDIMIDGREQAPLASNKDMFLDRKNNVITNLSTDGPLSTAIPGEPAALVYLAEHYGRLPLAKSLAPAIELARTGFPVTAKYQENVISRLAVLQKYPATAAVLLDKNRVPPLGYKIVQPDLANTLLALATEGNAGFYKGAVADKLVKGVRAMGGVWSNQDLLNYQVKLRQPLQAHYQNITITTAPPPSSGGVALLSILHLLSYYPNIHNDTLTHKHLIIEAMRLAYWDRAQNLGDPDYDPVPISFLLSDTHTQQLRRYISLNEATPSSQLPYKATTDTEQTHTTHLSILDQEGNRVSATLTINYVFGSCFIPPGTGVVLNDEMDDFSSKPGSPNVFSLVSSTTHNAIAPGKRPLSSMTPTFLEDEHRIAILGTPGGSRIPTMVLLATLDFAAGRLPQSWVSVPRIHHQYMPDVIQYEPNSLSPMELLGFQRMGYLLRPVPSTYGNMQAILWDQAPPFVAAAADPRGEGLAAVYPVFDGKTSPALTGYCQSQFPCQRFFPGILGYNGELFARLRGLTP